MTRVGIVGAGKLGTTLARLLVAAGHEVALSGSGPLADREFMLGIMVPGARAAQTADVVAESDLVFLALPLGRVPELAAHDWAGRIAVDATNYWEPTDGSPPAFLDGRSTSEAVAGLLPGARVVKAFSHLGYHDLENRAGEPDPVALAVASDDPAASRIVADLIASLGFDPVDLGSLAAGERLQPGRPAFGATLRRPQLEAAAAPAASLG